MTGFYPKKRIDRKLCRQLLEEARKLLPDSKSRISLEKSLASRHNLSYFGIHNCLSRLGFRYEDEIKALYKLRAEKTRKKKGVKKLIEK